jgi:hypothetical protein
MSCMLININVSELGRKWRLVQITPSRVKKIHNMQGRGCSQITTRQFLQLDTESSNTVREQILFIKFGGNYKK